MNGEYYICTTITEKKWNKICHEKLCNNIKHSMKHNTMRFNLCILQSDIFIYWIHFMVHEQKKRIWTDRTTALLVKARLNNWNSILTMRKLKKNNNKWFLFIKFVFNHVIFYWFFNSVGHCFVYIQKLIKC